MASGEPLSRLQAWQRQVDLPAAALRELAAGGSPDAATALVPAFDRALAAHRDHLQHSLVPELIESMAGSDPVCIRELAGALAQQLQDLQRQWRGLRGALLDGRPIDPAALLTLAEGCESLQSREQKELLTMAARLLDDAALSRLAQAAAALPPAP
jgi:hypothetical protein